MEEDGETGRGEEEVDVSGLDRVRNDCEELLDYSQFKIVWVRSWRCVDHCGARDITASVELDHTQWYCSVRQASLWHIMKYSYIVWGDVGYSWERALMYDWISGYSMRLCLHVVVRTHGLGGDCWGNYVVILLMWAWVLEFIRTTRVEHEIIRWGHDTAVDGLARYGSILSFSLIGLVGEWWDGDSQGQGFDCCSTERGEVDGGGDTVWDTHGVLMDEYRGDEDETTSCDVGHMNLEVPVVVIEGGYVEGGCLRYEYHLVGEVRCRLLWSKVGGFERYGVMSITQMCRAESLKIGRFVDHMMHGPYGAENPSCPCTIDYKCTKKFPKQFNESTVIDNNGYTIYKRRNDGSTIKKSGTYMHNGYIVPYNPGLLRRYQAHINIEYYNQVGSIKYLFKYINKGPDRVSATIDGEEVNEIKDYLNYRYLSAYETAWRIYGFDIHYRTPSVERLPFHFKDEQHVIFDAT
ncbi:hypothetical protein Tco_0750601 [Tanacetum coccineum]|uniref:Uncharacterized protein n=1 Tax=Tanacetum coccineum TaxID=301880 RepID=A0ABQ4Z1Z4_9ASTR